MSVKVEGGKLKKPCKIPPGIGLNMLSKTKDNNAKQFTCTVKGKRFQNRGKYIKLTEKVSQKTFRKRHTTQCTNS